MTYLIQQIKNFEHRNGGIVGVCAMHLPSNQLVQYNETQSFLMCSTYKVPMAVCLLQKIKSGEIKQDFLVDINSWDLRPGLMSTLNQMDYSTPVKMSVLNLLQYMMQESCNT